MPDMWKSWAASPAGQPKTCEKAAKKYTSLEQRIGTRSHDPFPRPSSAAENSSDCSSDRGNSPSPCSMADKASSKFSSVALPVASLHTRRSSSRRRWRTWQTFEASLEKTATSSPCGPTPKRSKDSANTAYIFKACLSVLIRRSSATCKCSWTYLKEILIWRWKPNLGHKRLVMSRCVSRSSIFMSWNDSFVSWPACSHSSILVSKRSAVDVILFARRFFSMVFASASDYA